MSKLLLPLLLTSCSSLHVSTGLIDPAFGGKLKHDAKNLSAFHTSIQMEQYVYKHDNFQVTAGIGPSVSTPLDGRSSMYGIEVSNRLVWSPGRLFQPFLYHAHGIQYHDTKWLRGRYTAPVEYSGSDTQYEFSTRFGAGIACHPTENLSIDVSWQWVHFSNGRSMLGDATRQFFHLPKAKTNDGFESGALFIGVQYVF